MKILVVWLLCVCPLSAASLSVNFDMHGDYSKNLYAINNMVVRDINFENVPPVRFWGLDKYHQWGSIIYRYTLDEPIKSASFYAVLKTYNVDEGYIDVSHNALDWITVQSGDTQIPRDGTTTPLIPITNIVKDSNDIFIRARVKGGLTSQFLPTGYSWDGSNQPIYSPNVFFVQATSVPEPSSLMLLVFGFNCCLVLYYSTWFS